jgi:hypothetical protein
MKASELSPFDLPPPYSAADFESPATERPYRSVTELEDLVLGMLLRQERTNESQIVVDWELGRVGMEQSLELLKGRLQAFDGLRAMAESETEEVDPNSIYARAMVRLYTCWTARSILRLRSLTFVKPEALGRYRARNRGQHALTSIANIL